MLSEKTDHLPILRCLEQLNAADRVLIAAGAGLSADAGLDYTDRDFFRKNFPAMAKRGFRCMYDLMGYHGWGPSLQWGYLATQVNTVRYKSTPQLVYTGLLSLVREKDHFVITSNADGMFATSGFDEERVFTPQGSYARYQCLKPCSSETWAFKPVLDRILPLIDPETMEVTDLSVIPHCPKCGGPVFINVRGGDWFVEDAYRDLGERYACWVQASLGSRLLILEIGSGFNTPGVIRWPMERLVRLHPRAHLLRVNRDHGELPDWIGKKGTSIAGGALDWVTAMVSKKGEAS